MVDERANLPSASSFNITAACHGSEQLIKSLPENERNVIDLPDEQAERGTRIHRAWQTNDPSGLSEDEAEDLHSASYHASELVGAWVRSVKADKQNSFREARLWLHDDGTLEPVLSGQPDLLLVSGKYALVVDLKSGWCKHLTPSEQSWQLRVLAVLAVKNYGVTHVRVAFVKPKIWRRPTDITDYSESDLARAESEIFTALWRSRQPGAQRIPGPHCTYCKAKAYCIEGGAYSLMSSARVTNISAFENGNAESLVQQMSLEDVGLIHRRAGAIYKILEASKARLKQQTAAVLDDLGLKRAPGRRLDPITDVSGAFDFLLEFGIPKEKIWQAMSMGKTDLVEIIREQKGWTKSQSSEFLRNRLAPFIEPKNADDSIVLK